MLQLRKAKAHREISLVSYFYHAATTKMYQCVSTKDTARCYRGSLCARLSHALHSVESMFSIKGYIDSRRRGSLKTSRLCTLVISNMCRHYAERKPLPPPDFPMPAPGVGVVITADVVLNRGPDGAAPLPRPCTEPSASVLEADISVCLV